MLGVEELLGNAGPGISESQAAESFSLLSCFLRLPLSPSVRSAVTDPHRCILSRVPDASSLLLLHLLQQLQGGRVLWFHFEQVVQVVHAGFNILHE